MLEDDPNERPTLPAPDPFASEHGDAETLWWLDSRRRWLVRWVLAVVGMAAAVLCAAVTMKLLP